MKNLSLIINAVLGAAVIVLYVLFFTGKDGKSGNFAASDSPLDSAMMKHGIVYINIDSVLQGYNMYTDLSDELQGKLKTSEAKLNAQQTNFQKKVQDFQNKVEKGLMTRAEAGEQQQQLAQEEQSLYQLQNNLQMQLAEEEQVAQRKVLNSIMEYLKKLSESGTYNYQFVLGTTFGGNILYADENKNITDAVIEGLNEDYQKTLDEKKK